MQALCEWPRNGLTAEQVVHVVQNSAAPNVTTGLEIIDAGLGIVDDISDDLAALRITRSSYAELHASAALGVSRLLDWGAGLVRPYVTMSADGISARFYLGAYHGRSGGRPLGESPATFGVDGYDMLWRLSLPVGDAYAVSAGDSYLDKVEQILLAQGYQAYLIDQAAAATVLPVDRGWAFDDQVTWLSIVNNLLDSIGYAGIWADWNGRLRCEPYQVPVNRQLEWTYTDDVATTMLGRTGTVSHDFFQTPNRWVFYRSNRLDETPPTEGNGKYTYVNQSVGEASVDARGGLVITRPPVGLDVADHASLVLAAQQMIQDDMDIPTVIERPTALNPLEWHFGRVRVLDGSNDLAVEAQCTAWSMTLAPEVPDMQQSWRAISQ
jgi:hypothetical protein